MIPVSSARLTFRSWTEKDAALAEALWCDSEVTHYFGGAMTREQAHNRLDIERERENRLGVQYWPMFLRETGEFVGCAGLRQWQMDPKMIEAGVHLMRSSWGLRLGEEALRTVLAYGFETLGLPTIVAGHGIGHNNSQKIGREQNVDLELSKSLLSMRIRFRCEGYRTLRLELESRVHLRARSKTCHGPPESFQVFHSQ
jgi:ribosomal-protein-alanine N-acetyltransferase